MIPKSYRHNGCRPDSGACFVTLKKLAEYWRRQWVLADIPPAWWNLVLGLMADVWNDLQSN